MTIVNIKPFNLSKQLHVLSGYMKHHLIVLVWTQPMDLREAAPIGSRSQMTLLWAAQQKIGLGTAESRKTGINISRNFQFWADCIIVEFYHHVLINSKWVYPCTKTWYRGLDMEILLFGPFWHPLVWVLLSTTSPVAAMSKSVGESRGIQQNLLPLLGSLRN